MLGWNGEVRWLPVLSSSLQAERAVAAGFERVRGRASCSSLIRAGAGSRQLTASSKLVMQPYLGMVLIESVNYQSMLVNEVAT